MPYEIYSRPRSSHRSSGPEPLAVEITKSGRLMLNDAATTFFKGLSDTEFVVLLWDASERKIGIQPIAKKNPQAYTLKYGNKRCSFMAKDFLNHFGIDLRSRYLPATWNSAQDLLEAELPR